MKTKVKVALISFSAIIGSSIISGWYMYKSGKEVGAQNAMIEVNEGIQQTARENGININYDYDPDSVQYILDNYKNVVDENKKYQEEYNIKQNDLNETLRKNNETIKNLEDSLKIYKDENTELKTQLSSIPALKYVNAKLLINGDESKTNDKNSLIYIDNVPYYSEQIVNALISEKYTLTLKDDVLYYGKIIKEKALLSSMWVITSKHASYENSIIDSFGFTRTNALCFFESSASIVQNLNQDYNFIKGSIHVLSDSSDSGTSSIQIYADGKLIVDKPNIAKTTEKIEFDESINGASKLEIIYESTNWRNKVAICDAIVYN